MNRIWFKRPHTAGININMSELAPRRSSRAWYLLPIFFLLLGGLISYVILFYRDPSRARNTLILGVILTIPWTMIIIVGMIIDVPSSSSADDMHAPLELTYTISHSNVPDSVDEAIVLAALDDAVNSWNFYNPELNFEIKKIQTGVFADIHILWREQLNNTVGTILLSTTITDYIEIKIGHWCDDGYQTYPRKHLSSVITHNFEYYFELKNAHERNNIKYDSLGYDVPDMYLSPITCTTEVDSAK